MNPENIEDIYTLSPTQQGILWHILQQPDSGMYLEQIICKLQGEINILAFEKAWQAIINRHPSLRTGFIYKQLRHPLQVVHRQVKLAIKYDDWQCLLTSEQDEKLNILLSSDRQRGFALNHPPLMRFVLIQIGANTYRLIWSICHLIIDGWCTEILLREFLSLYPAFCHGHKITLQPCYPYRNYITWLKQQDLSASAEFWQQILQGFSQPTPIGISHHDLSHPVISYGQQKLQLNPELSASLKFLAKQHYLTLNTLFMGVWALLISHDSQQQDVLFGMVTSGRPTTLPGVESIVGLFVNTLPTRVQIPPQNFLIPWLKKLQLQYKQLCQYEHTPLASIQSWSEVSGRLPLFASLLACQNSLVDVSHLQTENLKIDDIQFFSHSNYPLSLVLMLGNQLEIVVHYNLHNYQDTKIARMIKKLDFLFQILITKSQYQLGTINNLITDFVHKDKLSAAKLMQNTNAQKLQSIKPKMISFHQTTDNQTN